MFFKDGINFLWRDALKPIDRKLWIYAGSWGEYRRNFICIRLYLIAFFVVSTEAIFYLYSAVYTNFVIGLLHALFFLLAIYLFSIGKILLTKNITFWLTNVVIFYTASLFGREAFEYLNFVPLIVAVVFFYGSRDYKYMGISLVITFLNLTILEMTNYSLFKTTLIPDHNFSFNKWLLIVMTLLFAFYMIYELLIVNMHTEEKMKRLNNNLKVRNTLLKKSNEELDSFVYRASHDLRSPLASIMGVINVVKTEKDITRIKDYMLYQERAIKKLDDLIQDVLDISRNARLDVLIEPISLKKLIQSCVDSFSYMKEFSNVEITVDIPEYFVLYSDARRLKVIFNNLISNSLRYYDPGKEKSYLKIKLFSGRPEVATIVFKDNGIGIAEKHLANVFGMFYRGTDQNTGSGLGLYIVKDAVDKLHGEIELSSILKEETKVVLRIPNQEVFSEDEIYKDRIEQ